MRIFTVLFALVLAFPAFAAFAPFMAVTNPAATGVPVNTAIPTITGSAVVGSPLTATNGSWTNSPLAYAYQWNGNGAPISGATSGTYIPVIGDVGHTITVTVTASNAFGNGLPATSSATAAVVNGSVPVNTVAPAISGASPPQVGAALTVSTGTWTNSPTGYTYQWEQDCSSNIVGATTNSYTPVSGDVGHTLCAAVVASNGSGSGTAANSNTTSAVVSAGTGDYAFTALHTYYMSPTGSGTTCSSSSPCADPNGHASVCGDVWIAKAGTYTNQIDITTQPTGCPSTSGGIDGTGGIYFAVVVCETAFACNANNSGVSGGEAIVEVDQVNNWAVEGFVSTTTGGNAGCFSGHVHGLTLVTHHIAFVNDQCNNSGLGFFNGKSTDNGGSDYMAFVGVLTWKANQRADFPSASIVFVGPKNSDTTAGTHLMIAGSFGIFNQVASGNGAYSDLECMMLDTFDADQFVGTTVVKNNICYSSSWVNLQVFMQAEGSSAPIFQISQNTFFNSGQYIPAGFPNPGVFGGGMNFQLNGGYPWTLNIFNNISLEQQQTMGGPQGGGPLYAAMVGGAAPGVGSTVFNLGGSGIENYIFSTNPPSSCGATTCSTGNYAGSYNGFSLGTNTYSNPLLKNTSDLLTNHVGQPNCSGFANVAACMGVNYGGGATALSVVDDLTPTASGTSGKGYQQPGPCAADSTYPTWMKGVVYLYWDGTNLTEKAGLAQKPCNL